MKITILLLLAGLISLTTHAQNVQLDWAVAYGGNDNEMGRAITRDANGNIYVLGTFEGTADFDPDTSTYNLTSNGKEDVFVQKLDSNGTFVWAKAFGAGNNDRGHSISYDNHSGILMTGTFNDTVDFNPNSGTYNIMGSGGSNVFTLKLDTAGNFLWAKAIIGPGLFSFSSCIDNSGNIYTTGVFRDTVDFNPGPGVFILSNPTYPTNYDAFIQKLDSNGNFKWAKSIGGGGTEWGYAITHRNGKLFIAGTFQSTVDFNPDTSSYTLSATTGKLFILSLDDNGNFLWAKNFGSPVSADIDAITTDHSGNVYSIGKLKNRYPGDFDPGLDTFELTAKSIDDIFIQKLDVNGNFKWAKAIHGTAGSNYGHSITTDNDANIFLTGDFSYKVDFDPGSDTFELKATKNSPDAFVEKLDSNGNFIWVKTVAGTASGKGIVTGSNGRVFVAGYFISKVDFNPASGVYNLISKSYNAYDAFVLKLKPCTTVFVIDTITACVSYKWVNGVTYTNNNTTAIDTLESSFGCDSIVTLNLTITPVDIGVTRTSTGLKANASTGSYQWLAWRRWQYNKVYQDTLQSFSATSDGNYALEITQNGCKDTSGSIPILTSSSSHFPNFAWAASDGNNGVDQGRSIATDDSGNVYVTGYFEGTTDFDPGAKTFNLTSKGSKDVFIQKLDAQGHLVWAKSIGAGSADIGYSISVDNYGNALILGIFKGTVDFDPGTSTHLLSSQIANNVFILKLNTNGGFVWAKVFGNPNATYAYSLTTDNSGNIYSTGQFYNTVDFNPGSATYNLTETSSGYGDVFIQKLDSNGNFKWAKSIGGGQSEGALAITTRGGKLFIAGTFQNTVDFDPDTSTNILSGDSGRVFILSLDDNGNFQWAKNFGGTDIRSIATDLSGNVYATGIFWGTGDFDPGAGVYNLTAKTQGSIFIEKLNSSGNFVWARALGNGLPFNYGQAITTDSVANVFTTGSFNGVVDFDPSAATYNLSANTQHLFIQKLDSNGNFVWASSFGAGVARGFGISTDKGKLYVTGEYRGTVDFDPSSTTHNMSSKGNFDAFVLKLSTCTPDKGTDTVSACVSYKWIDGVTYTSNNNTATYLLGNSNDCDSLVTLNLTIIPVDVRVERTNSGLKAVADSVSYQWLDCNSYLPVVGDSLQTFTATNNGNYAVQITQNGCTDTSECVPVLTSSNSHFPNFAWAASDGNTGVDQGRSVATDDSGNVYVTGYFEGTIDFDPGANTFNLTSKGGKDIFIKKLDPQGHLVWAKAIGGTTDFDRGHSIALDDSGNVFVTGIFHTSADFDPDSSTFSLTANGTNSFILKLSKNGKFKWAKSIDGNRNYGEGIAIDNSGNVYTTGFYRGTADFDPGSGTYNLTSGQQSADKSYVLKLSSQGNFVWAISSQNYYGRAFAHAITINTSNEVLITGTFTSLVDFDPDTSTFILNSADGAVFVQKLSASGTLIWVKNFAGDFSSAARSINTDKTGNVYITGGFWKTADFDPGSGVYNLTAKSSGYMFIEKLNAKGDFVWARAMGSGLPFNYGQAITTDSVSNVYTTGSFYGLVDFDPSAATYNLNANTSNLFIQKLDSNGNFVWANSFGAGNAIGYGISTKKGKLYVTGEYKHTVDFDPSPATHNLSSKGDFDAFVLKLSTCTPDKSTDTVSACISYKWIDGITYTANNNTATYILGNSNDCDSIVTLNLTINQPTTGIDSIVACDSITWNKIVYTANNFTALDTLTSKAGCDSVVTLALTINNSSTGTHTKSVCDSYTWNGITYTNSNSTALDTLTNKAGCDSIVTLNLTIRKATTGTHTKSVCGSYTWNGITYTNSNSTALDTLVNKAGCDSIVTLNLTIRKATSGTHTKSVCGSYTWNGVTYISSNSTALDTLTNKAGCDSIVTLNLTIKKATSGIHTKSVCGSYTWNGITYTSSNSTALDTLINKAGCDSIVTLNLIIKKPTSGTHTKSVCGSYTWNGITYTNSNSTALDTLTNKVGCDSIVTLNLTIKKATSGTHTKSICGSYTWNGITYTNSNSTALDTLTNKAGCDSIVTLNLTIRKATTGTHTKSVCGSYTWNGIAYTNSNSTALDTLINKAGCDSIVTLNLTIKKATSGTHTKSVCDSYTWNGITYTNSNSTALDTLTNKAGCDSIVTLNLTIRKATLGTHTKSVCGSYTWNGVTYSNSNSTALDTLTNKAGCDSIVTLNLTIRKATSGTHTKSVCGSFTWNGITYTNSNSTALDTLINKAGCDSIVTLNLTIKKATTGTHTKSVCGSYTWNGVTYISSNSTALDTLINKAGCDSIVTLNLTIKKATTGTHTKSVCGSYTWNGITYTNSNSTALDTLTNKAGCDSIVTLNLTIKKTTSGIDVITACDSYKWIDGVTYTANNNSAKHTIKGGAAGGCDSVVTLNLTINKSNAGIDVVKACDTYTWIDGNTYTSDNNSAKFTLVNVAGCDSVVTLNLTINSVNVSVTTADPQISANTFGALYQWLDCDNNYAIISGEKERTFTASTNGEYAVEITKDNCTDTSKCIIISTVGSVENNVFKLIKIYPNPVGSGHEMVNIDLGELQNISLHVFTTSGRLIYQKVNIEEKLFQFELSGPVGVYYIELKAGDYVQRFKIIKN